MQSSSVSHTEGDDGNAQDSDAQDSDATQPCDKPIKIRTCAKDINCSATWKDGSNTAQCLNCLSLRIEVDTKTANTAIFRLSLVLFLKHRENNKQPVYLYICASDIDTITVDIDDSSVPSLHFFLRQNPSFVGPRGYPLVAKNNQEESLDSLLALASQKNFTIRLKLNKSTPNESMLNESTLRKMESIFSRRNTKPPDNNLDLNELKSLYNGNGGEVLKKSKNISNICKDESPPPYAAPTHRKRKRTSTTEDEATRLKQDPQFHLQDYTDVVMDGLNKLAARLDKIEGRLSSLEEGLSNVREDVRQVDHTISSELDAIVNPNVKYEVEAEVTNQLEELKEEVDVLVAGKLSDFEDEHEKGRARERQETDEYHEQLQQNIYNDMDRQFKEEWGRRQPEIKRLVNEQVKESIAKIRLAVID